MNRLFALLFISLLTASCNQQNNQNPNNMVVTEEKKQSTIAIDAHTCAMPNEAVATHLDLDVEVDFTKKQIIGKASYQIKNVIGTDHILFDTYDLTIQKVTVGNPEKETKFELGAKDKNLGQALKVTIDSTVKMLTIYYSSNPAAQALQWLDAQQTADKKKPFLFTQSESIFARSWVPCQDSPGIRFTYSAKVKVPKDLLAVMSAENPIAKNDSGIYHFNMPQAIPAYLLALAVGDIEFKSVGPRTGIYAEHSMLDKAVYEFSETEDMLVAAEKLYGAYRWGRYDIIVLPPSFPFGGMENPRLTFATPTVIAGDRSLTSLVAHEMAHSWSGNLVTNATWNDFWLNEGFTVYFERRILEVIYGLDYAEMQAALGKQDAINTMNELGMTSEDTKLKLNLNGRHPDDGMTDIAYEKGCLFLRLIEENVGREKLDAFLNKYFNEFAFKTMTTEMFIDYLKKELIKGDTILEEKLTIDQWVYNAGMPANCPNIISTRLQKVDKAIEDWVQGVKPLSHLPTREWSTHEWVHFIRHLPYPFNPQLPDQMKELDNTFHFTNTGNCEILAEWLHWVILNKYSSGYGSLEKFLTTVGRRKYVLPLYKDLVKTEEGKKMAAAIFAKAKGNYHFVTASSVEEVLK